MVLGPGDQPPVRIELSLLWFIPRFTPSVVFVKADNIVITFKYKF